MSFNVSASEELAVESALAGGVHDSLLDLAGIGSPRSHQSDPKEKSYQEMKRSLSRVMPFCS